MFTVKKILPFFAFICLSVVFISCSTNKGKKFTPVDEGFLIESGKSIAVLSGTNGDNDINLAELISERMIIEGRLKVMPQAEISRRIPRYPLNVNLIDFSYNDKRIKNNPSYLSDTSKAGIDAVQKILKTDYILIVWIDSLSSLPYNDQRAMNVASRLISYPAAKVVAYSFRWNEKHSYCCLFPVKWIGVFENASIDLTEEIYKNVK